MRLGGAAGVGLSVGVGAVLRGGQERGAGTDRWSAGGDRRAGRPADKPGLSGPVSASLSHSAPT